jgi:hypothetical protein
MTFGAAIARFATYDTQSSGSAALMEDLTVDLYIVLTLALAFSLLIWRRPLTAVLLGQAVLFGGVAITGIAVTRLSAGDEGLCFLAMLTIGALLYVYSLIQYLASKHARTQ